MPRAPLLPAACLALALAGCIVTGAESGIRIGDATLAQFEAGTTTEAWLYAILGEPNSIGLVRGDEGVRVLRYTTVQEERRGLLTALFRGTAPQRTVATVYFVVRDGTIVRFWADRAESGGLLGGDSQSGEKRD